MKNGQPTPAKIDLPRADHLDGDLPDIVDMVMEMGSSTSPARLEALVETATAYAKAASSENTRDAYAKEWRHFTSWCRRDGFDPLPPSSQVIGLYIGACAAGDPKRGLPSLSVATIERRLTGLAWNFTSAGLRSTAPIAASPPCSQASAASTQNRRGRRKPWRIRPDLPGRRARELDPFWPHRQRPSLPPHLQGQQDRRRRTSLRQACRPPWPPASAPILRKGSARCCSQGTRCAAALPLRPTSRSATYRSISAMPRPR